MNQGVLERVEKGENLSQEEMAAAIGAMMEGLWSEDHIARLLLALHRKGETVAEVAGAAAALRARMSPIRCSAADVIDVVGTGGDGSGTFNISTAAALVAAAAGATVAKHGNRRFTSRSGAADVLRELGVNIEAEVPVVEACLEELGICFCFAPLLHRAMRHVAPVRQKLGTPTIFNILGPLANPAGATLQLLGVGKPHLRPLLAEALALLGTRRVLVVHGADGLDEVTLTGTTYVTEQTSADSRQFVWSPADFGLEKCTAECLKVEGPQQSAAVIRRIFSGEKGPCRDVVVANAAAALWVARIAPDIGDAARRAAEAIDSGRAAELLAELAHRTHA